MALGATGGAIFAHVLAEVLVVTVMGGLLGLGLGTALTGVLPHFMQMPAVVSPFIAAVPSVTALSVGTHCRAVPGRCAPRGLSPGEALRYA